MTLLSLVAIRRLCLLVACLIVPAGRLAAETTLTGIWTGRYEYPPESGNAPVPFTATIVQQGEQLFGLIREENTFGNTQAPQLHASLVGTYYEANGSGGALIFRKTYDGTSGQSHAVTYLGAVDLDASTIEGVWTIPGAWSGMFVLSRAEGEGEGPLAGVWNGAYGYPEQVGVEEVPFTAVLVHGPGNRIAGWIREPNSFGTPDEPFLQAGVTGTFEAGDGSVRFTKTYDGTAGEHHDVLYEGRLEGRATLIGTWRIPDGWGARFTMKPLREKAAQRALEERVDPPAPAVPVNPLRTPAIF